MNSPMTCRHAGPADQAALLKLLAPGGQVPGGSGQGPSVPAGGAGQPPLAGGGCGKSQDRFAADLADDDCSWLVGLEGKDIVAAACLRLERETRIGKVLTLCGHGPDSERLPRLKSLLEGLLAQVRSSRAADIVYSTTRTLTDAEQAVTVDAGFKPLAVFPGAKSLEGGPVSGLTAWYADGVLSKLRHADFALHPAVAPFYSLASGACGLPPLAPAPTALPAFHDVLPPLELVEAPLFAAERFRRMKARRSLSVNFYPFSDPNVVVLSPDEGVQVFASLLPGMGFATVIGEYLRSSVHPVKLYRETAALLRSRGAVYIEAINDAADATGIECILAAGFRPCGYFPCLKLSGPRRRDFVVFAHSEVRSSDRDATHPMHRPFLDEYLKGGTGAQGA